MLIDLNYGQEMYKVDYAQNKIQYKMTKNHQMSSSAAMIVSIDVLYLLHNHFYTFFAHNSNKFDGSDSVYTTLCLVDPAHSAKRLPEFDVNTFAK